MDGATIVGKQWRDDARAHWADPGFAQDDDHPVVLITWDDAGRIIDFKVMIRPLQAIQLIHQKMAAMLQAER